MTAPTPPARRAPLTLGPGTLNFGGVGSALDMSCQVTSVTVSPEAQTEDPIPVLCGDALAGARSYNWTLAFTALQDVLENGVIDYTWTNAGAEVPFTFVPSTDYTAQVTGVVIIDPVGLGGTVRQKNTSDASWTIVGTPAFTADGVEAAGTTPAG